MRDRCRLDAALADGADPGDDPALALRARALGAPRTRRRIAATIGDLLDAAEEPPDAFGPHGPRPPLQRASVLSARSELVTLADRLAGPDPVAVQAIALTALLVWDGASPVYAPHGDATVLGWTLAALAA
jgi:hypothetical protein